MTTKIIAQSKRNFWQQQSEQTRSCRVRIIRRISFQNLGANFAFNTRNLSDYQKICVLQFANRVPIKLNVWLVNSCVPQIFRKRETVQKTIEKLFWLILILFVNEICFEWPSKRVCERNRKRLRELLLLKPVWSFQKHDAESFCFLAGCTSNLLTVLKHEKLFYLVYSCVALSYVSKPHYQLTLYQKFFKAIHLSFNPFFINYN